MFYFLPFYSLKLNEKMHFNVMNQSWKVPVFLFLYSPHCGHCKEVKPDWKNLSQLYKNDPKIIIAELNCENYNHICSKRHEVTGYPSWRYILKGHSRSYSGERDLNAFKTEAERLKSLKMDELCQVLNENKLNSSLNFPAFVINHTGTLKEACALVDKFVDKDYSLENQFYLNVNQSEMSASVYSSPEHSVILDSPYSNKKFKKFLKEYKTKAFATIKWSEAMSKNRPLVIMIVNDLKDVNQYKDFGVKYLSHYFAAITVERFKFLNGGSIPIDKVNYPAAIITNDKKNRYVILSDVNTSIIENAITQDFESLDNIKQKRLSFIFRDLVLFPGSKFSNTTIYLIITAIVVSLLIGAYYTFCDGEPTYKFE